MTALKLCSTYAAVFEEYPCLMYCHFFILEFIDRSGCEQINAERVEVVVLNQSVYVQFE